MLNKLLTGMLLLAASTACAASDQVQFPEEIIERFDNSRVIIYINTSDITDTPAWNLAAGEPPLTIQALSQIIRTRIAQDDTLKDAVVDRIELKRIQHHEAQQRWYYLVEMKTLTDGRTLKHYLAVLMDGKVVPAIREPESYK